MTNTRIEKVKEYIHSEMINGNRLDQAEAYLDQLGEIVSNEEYSDLDRFTENLYDTHDLVTQMDEFSREELIAGVTVSNERVHLHTEGITEDIILAGEEDITGWCELHEYVYRHMTSNNVNYFNIYR